MMQPNNTPFTDLEHKRFVEALEIHGGGKKGNEWSLIMEMVGTKSLLQVW
jgi:hypothetical protein